MNRLLPILLIIGILSCQNLVDKSTEIEKSNSSPTNTIDEINLDKKAWEYEWGFKRENGSFLRYICEGENMFIEYGNENFRKILEDTFACTDPYVGIPRQWWDNKDFICLRYGCGSPCWGAIILPLNNKDTVENYMYQYEYDETRNVIIYLDYESEEEKRYLIARNLKTKATEKIEFEPCDEMAFSGYCIDSISYTNGNLYLQTRTERELKKGMDSKGSNVIKKKIQI